MKAYHMSETLKIGDTLEVDYQRTVNLAEPFVQALEQRPKRRCLTNRGCSMAIICPKRQSIAKGASS